MLPTLVRESWVERSFPREPEPELVMDDPEQVEAYVRAGRIDSDMAAAYLFHSARVTQLIQGCEFVVDLACGPATQLAQIAALNPTIEFLGIDLSRSMLDSAQAHVTELGLTNVRFEQTDITHLADIRDASADAVISTMALHHLPTLGLLEGCFREIRRILKPGGKLYLADFGRLKSLNSVLFFAYMNRRHQPHLFSLDYERSLRAAFLPADFVKLTRDLFGAGYQVLSTALVPILVLIKSRQEQAICGTAAERLKAMRQALPRRYRRELDDMRLLFWLGGLRGDPFP